MRVIYYISFCRPDTQYKHTPDKELNSRLNVVVALTLACVLGLGLGHFLGKIMMFTFYDELNCLSFQEHYKNVNIKDYVT